MIFFERRFCYDQGVRYQDAANPREGPSPPESKIDERFNELSFGPVVRMMGKSRKEPLWPVVIFLSVPIFINSSRRRKTYSAIFGGRHLTQ